MTVLVPVTTWARGHHRPDRAHMRETWTACRRIADQLGGLL